MTKRNPTRAIRSGARVLDGRGTGTALNSTGLPPLCDPRDWIWIQWDGSRGLKPARFADIRLTADQTTRPGKPFGPLPPGCRPVSPSDSPPATETAPSPGAADTTERLAKVRACIAGAADELYEIDRDTLDAPGYIDMIAAANDIRAAERALARLIGEG